MRRRDPGFTLIEILIAVVLVGILSVVVVLGVGALTRRGASAACAASADAARAATVVHYTNTAAYPGTITAMVAAAELQLPASATVAPSGVAVSTANWVMTMQPGQPPTFSCASTSTAVATTVVVSTTTLAAVTALTPIDATTRAATVCVVDPAGAALADATISTYTDGWKVVGSTTAKGCLDVRVPIDTAYVAAQLHGVTRQLRWTDGVRRDATTEFDFATSARFVRVVDGDGNGVIGAEARYLGERWETMGTTGKDGCASAELLAGNIYVGAVDRGVTVQQVVNLVVTPSDSCKTAVVFARVARFLRVVEQAGNPVAGVASRYYGSEWQALDPTAKDGCTSVELVGGFIYFGITYDRGERQQGVELAKIPSGSCEDAVVLTT